jgi:hypothetical protein
LTFACQMYEQKPNREGRLKTSLLCIDKRTGRRAYKGEFINQTGILEITGNTEKKAVDLVMQRDTVSLAFTDKPPLPVPAPGKQAAASSPGGKTMRAIWDSFRKMLDRLVDESDSDDDN